MREIYLDNSSTTKPSESVISVMLKTMTEDYGNPSSMHRKGLDAERYVRNAREDIAKVLKASPAELVFTSGGTESNNMAIFGAERCAQMIDRLTAQAKNALQGAFEDSVFSVSNI